MTDAVHFADIVQMRPDYDTACTHEEGNFHNRMSHEVQVRPLKRQRRQKRTSKHDIAKLTDSRKREPPFQIVLPNRDK